MSNKQQNELLEQMLCEAESKENDFPIISDCGELPKRYRGLALEINERGNVTVWNCFKNGSVREIASRV